jgi:hypothetical protein
MWVDFIKVSKGNVMASTGLLPSPTQTSAKRTGELLSLISLFLGLICVLRAPIPGHVSHTFLCSPISAIASTFDPAASFVSPINLHRDCPSTLLQALADAHLDHDIWLASYKEEKEGLESLNTFCMLKN